MDKNTTTIIVNPAIGFESGDEGIFLVDGELMDVRLVYKAIHDLEATEEILKGQAPGL